MTQIILFNKPYGVLSQFTPADGHPGLGQYISDQGYYPAGRLDRDSEGLLLLTDNGQLQARISQPEFKLPKTYLVQLEGEITPQALQQLKAGVNLKDGITLPAKACTIDQPRLWQRSPPVRKRQNIPTSWISLTIAEGKNRQVRRMTAAVGYPTLRLVRQQIGPWQLGALQPGELTMKTVNLPTKTGKTRSRRKPRYAR